MIDPPASLLIAPSFAFLFRSSFFRRVRRIDILDGGRPCARDLHDGITVGVDRQKLLYLPCRVVISPELQERRRQPEAGARVRGIALECRLESLCGIVVTPCGELACRP